LSVTTRQPVAGMTSPIFEKNLSINAIPLMYNQQQPANRPASINRATDFTGASQKSLVRTISQVLLIFNYLGRRASN